MNKETEDVCENILCEICWLICPLKFPLVKMLVHLNVHDHHPIWTYFCDFFRCDCWAISYLQLERIHFSIHVFFTLAVFSVRVRCHSRHTTNKPIYCLLSVLCVGFIPSKNASNNLHFIAQKAITKINGTTLTAICLTDVQLENVFFFIILFLLCTTEHFIIFPRWLV